MTVSPLCFGICLRLAISLLITLLDTSPPPSSLSDWTVDDALVTDTANQLLLFSYLLTILPFVFHLSH